MNLQCLFPVLLSGRPHFTDDYHCGGLHHGQHWNRRLLPDSAVPFPHGHRHSHAPHGIRLRIHHLLALQTQTIVSQAGSCLVKFER